MTDRIEFKEWNERDAYDIVQPDCDTTGLGEGWHVLQLADQHRIPCIPHNRHGDLSWMSNIQLVATISNRKMLESCQDYNPFRSRMFQESIIIEGSYAEVTSGQGLGVELVDDLEERFPYDSRNRWLKNPPG